MQHECTEGQLSGSHRLKTRCPKGLRTGNTTNFIHSKPPNQCIRLEVPNSALSQLLRQYPIPPATPPPPPTNHTPSVDKHRC